MLRIVRLTSARVSRSFNACPLTQQSSLQNELPPETAFLVLERIAIFKAISPVYSSYAAAIRNTKQRDPVLRRGVTAITQLAAYLATLRSARPDYCRVLTQWHRRGFGHAFDVARAIGVPSSDFTTTGIPSSLRLRRIDLSLKRASARLASLEHSATRSQLFLSTADLLR